MSSASSVERNIQKIQKKLFSEDIDCRKVLKYIKYLAQLEVTLDVLKSTGIGKTINGLKKMEGPIGDAANNLIKQWKGIVTGPAGSDRHEEACPSPAKLNPALMISSHTTKTTLSKGSTISYRKEEEQRQSEHSSHKHGKHTKEKHHKHREKEKNEKHEHTKSKPKAPSLQLCDVSFGCETPPEPVKQKRKDPPSSSKKEKKYKYDTDSSDNFTLPPLPSVYSVSEALLPEITPTYRPSRQLDLEGSPAKKNKGTISGSFLHDDLLTSKKSRTQVFSGRRNANMCGVVTSLFDHCLKVLIDNIEALHDTGGVPYDILAPALAKCTPQQLIHLEECNPYFLEDTDDLWQTHCRRELKCDKPERKMTWRDTYMLKMQEREEKLAKINAKITAAQAAKKPERQVKLAYVMTEAKPPPQIRRKQAKFGTGVKEAIPLISPSARAETSPVKPRAPRQHSAENSHREPAPMATKKKSAGAAPMMKKTMKLLKIQRNCNGAQIRRR